MRKFTIFKVKQFYYGHQKRSHEIKIFILFLQKPTVHSNYVYGRMDRQTYGHAHFMEVSALLNIDLIAKL